MFANFNLGRPTHRERPGNSRSSDAVRHGRTTAKSPSKPRSIPPQPEKSDATERALMRIEGLGIWISRPPKISGGVLRVCAKIPISQLDPSDQSHRQSLTICAGCAQRKQALNAESVHCYAVRGSVFEAMFAVCRVRRIWFLARKRLSSL